MMGSDRGRMSVGFLVSPDAETNGTESALSLEEEYGPIEPDPNSAQTLGTKTRIQPPPHGFVSHSFSRPVEGVPMPEPSLAQYPVPFSEQYGQETHYFSSTSSFLRGPPPYQTRHIALPIAKQQKSQSLGSAMNGGAFSGHSYRADENMSRHRHGAVRAQFATRAKRMWTPEEDAILKEATEKWGQENWNAIGAALNGRTGKQCRERWLNNLRPDIRKGGWTKQEDDLILREQALRGNNWSAIARLLVGRSDNAVKNRFTSKLRKEAAGSSQLSSRLDTGERQRVGSAGNFGTRNEYLRGGVGSDAYATPHSHQQNRHKRSLSKDSTSDIGPVPLWSEYP